jgi:hypothetical protein
MEEAMRFARWAAAAATLVGVPALEAANPATTFFPIDDGDPNTSEYGYAGSSAINAVSFICTSLMTVSNKQIFAYYGRDQTNASYAFNNTIWIARRTVGSNLWEVFRTAYTANNITDGHDVVCFGIDGDGVLHMSWGMHGDAFHYSHSLTNVVSSEPIVMGPDSTMTGNENTATYPQFMSLPDGDLLYIYRKGTSGAGDTFVSRYSHLNKAWTPVHTNGTVAAPFIKGTGWLNDYNAYGQMPCLDSTGRLSLIWTWRYTSAFESNHDFDYGASPDQGLTWQRSDGSTYTLPIDESTSNGDPDPNKVGERILQISTNFTLINQAGMCLDSGGKPIVATWWAPGSPTNFQRQYMVVFPNTNGVWQTRQISHRSNDPTNTMLTDNFVRDLGRPVVVTDPQDRIIVLYRDNFGSNGLTIVHSLPKAVDPDRQTWTTFDLTSDNLGNYESVIDLARWQRDEVMDIVYQPSAGEGYSPPANTASQIGVLEWDAGAYFQYQPQLNLVLTNQSSVAALSFIARPSWGFRLLTSTNLLSSWQSVATWNNTNGPVRFVQPLGSGSQRFWKLNYSEGAIPPP